MPWFWMEQHFGKFLLMYHAVVYSDGSAIFSTAYLWCYLLCIMRHKIWLHNHYRAILLFTEHCLSFWSTQFCYYRSWSTKYRKSYSSRWCCASTARSGHSSRIPQKGTICSPIGTSICELSDSSIYIFLIKKLNMLHKFFCFSKDGDKL